MADTIDVKVRTQPGRAYELSTSLTTQAKTADSASSDVRSAALTVNTEMQGQAVSAMCASLATNASSSEGLSSGMTSLSSALNTFASTMASVKERLLSARDDAVSAGLEVSGDTIRMPPETSGSTASGTDSTYEAKKEKFQEISATVAQIRSEEDEAHTTLQSACHEISPPPAVGLAAGYAASVAPFVTMVNRASQTAEATAAALRVRAGHFLPTSGPTSMPTLKDVTLRNAWSKWKDAQAYKNALTSAKNWTPNPETANGLSWKAASTLGKAVDKAAPVLKAAGRVSTVASGVVSGWNQYQSDSEKHPGMGEGEKTARAGVKGAASAAGGYYGATGGAKVGAVAGAMVGGPVGAVVGGVAGGLIGGLVGSKVGDMAGDALSSGVSWIKNNFF